MTQRMLDVICLGEVCQDILLTGIPRSSLASAQDSFTARTWSAGLGGDAANEAVVLSHLGERVAFIGRIGRDAVGESLAGFLEAAGVDLSMAVRKEECRNILSTVIVTEDNAHTFLVGRGSMDDLRRSDLDPAVLNMARAVSFGGVFNLGSLDHDGLEEMARQAKEQGTVTFADLEKDQAGVGPEGHDDLYQYLDYVIPSYQEAAYVTGEDEPERMARHFMKLGARHVIIKLGEEGSYYCDDRESFYTDPYDVQAVDTTGCGDNFVAGLIHAVLAGAQMQEALRFANAAGALNSLGVGANRTVQNLQMVEEFMRTHRIRKIVGR